MLIRRLLPLLLAPLMAYAECLPLDQAINKVGATTCVRGDVVKVSQSGSGAHFLNFCSDYRQCPFFVVVFPRDLRHVGDVRQLEGRTIEVAGKIQLYGGRPEIVLRDARQLRGEAANLPPLPKNYDVARQGRYSPGQFRAPNTKHRRIHRPQTALQPPSTTGTAPSTPADINPSGPDEPDEK